MFNRVFFGIAMALGAVLLIVMDNLYVRLAVCLVLMLVATKEISSAYIKIYDNFSPLPGYVFSVLLVLLKYFFKNYGFELALLITVFTFLIVYVLKNAKHRKEEITTTLASFLPLVYPLILFEYLITALMLDTPNWRSVLILGVGIACLNDCFALTGGLLFGKHKLSPGISPNKTWEGAISGFLIGGVAGGALYFFAQQIWGGDMSLLWSIASGAILSIVAQFGDLVASSIKRVTGVKDFGNLIPGHGGVLDRLDSILFVVPIAYYAVLIYI